jgi:hypothetical protein
MHRGVLSVKPGSCSCTMAFFLTAKSYLAEFVCYVWRRWEEGDFVCFLQKLFFSDIFEYLLCLVMNNA